MQRINWKHYSWPLVMAAFVFFGSCSWRSSEYAKRVKKELAKGKRFDNLFFGIHLGMSSKEFYAHCWELNKKGLFTNGKNNTTVLYKIDKGLKYPASMNFYPDFYEDRIFRMRASFEYDAWAPWNKPQFADSLLPDVVQLYRHWYPEGDDFLEITNKQRGTIYVKIDGNRQITIGRFNDVMVKVDYTDLLIEKKLHK